MESFLELLAFSVVIATFDPSVMILAFALDYYGKWRNPNRVVKRKINCILFKSDYEKRHKMYNVGRPISKASFVFQLANMVYVLLYFILSLVETLIYPHGIVGLIAILGTILYTAVCSVVGAIIAAYAITEDEKKMK